MKVLVIGPSPVRSKGGMATVIEEIKNDVDLNRKFDIDIFESFIDGGIFKRMIYSVWAFIKFCISKRGYDIYHIHVASYGSTFRKGWYVRTVKKWGKKVVLHVHGAEYMVFFEKSRKKEKIISTLKGADLVVALSSEWKRRFDDAFALTNCVVLENGIDTDRLTPAVSDNSDHPYAFVMLGRLGERKGTYDLIKAIDIVRKEFPEVICYLAGDGDTARCSEIVRKKDLTNNVSIVGWTDFEKKLDLLQKSAVLVLPSYNEGLPMAILEGMACGKAIISTTVGAIPEVIKPENGILVEPGDVDALASAMLMYCKNPQAAEAAGSANKKLISDRFSMKAMHKKLEEIYQNAARAV